MKAILSSIPGLIIKNWQLVLLVGGLVFSYYRSSAAERQHAKLLQETKSIHAAELLALGKIRETERAEHAQNEKELRESLSLSQKKYEEEVKKITTASSEKVEKLTKTYGRNPTRLAAEFSKTTGVTVLNGERQ